MSIRHQCRLAQISRSGYYAKPVQETDLNLELMRKMDERYMEHPEYGVPRMTDWVKSEGYDINEKRISRLMQKMGIYAITPGPHTSRPSPENKIYPYLLRNVEIERVNQVWSTDITYIPMRKGYLYLAAVIDWYSRYILAWNLSNTMEADFCTSTLKQSLQDGTPEIFNTDQGSQFTSDEFTGALKEKNILISMDGKGRALDNVYIERFWWTLKYENVYPKVYENGQDLYEGLEKYFRYYNHEREHSSLGKKTPYEIYIAGKGMI
jgi:putative transposase